MRTTFIESIGRYNRLFSEFPPEIFAQFSERVPMVKGRLDPTASTATGYCWLVWRKGKNKNPILKWIPPCRKNWKNLLIMIMYKCPYYKMDVVFMTIPEVRAELERLAEKYGIPRLGELAEALYRSPRLVGPNQHRSLKRLNLAKKSEPIKLIIHI